MKRLYIPDSLLTYGLIFVLIAASFYTASHFIEPAPPRSFTLAAGSKAGAYYAFAEDYKQNLEKNGTEVNILSTTGSLENIRLLKDGKADFAFVQSGLAAGIDEGVEDLKSLGSLYFEPLWIFTRRDFQSNSLLDMEGLNLAVGGIGTGTREISVKLLEATGIDSEQTQLLDIGGLEAFNALSNRAVDVVFISAGISSDVVQQFLNEPEFRLFSERRAIAYDKKYPYLSYLTLPEGVLDLARNIPPRETELLASAALLVAGPSAHQTLRALLVHTAHDIHDQETPYVQEVDFPSSQFSDIPLASEAQRYYEHGPSFLQRYLPFWVADLADRLKVMLIPLITIMFPLMKIAPPTYRWRIRSKIYKWYKDLKKAEGLHSDASQRDLDEALKLLDDMDHEAKHTPVPLSYTDALYNLRMHISLVRDKLLRHHAQNDSTSAEDKDEPRDKESAA